MENNLFGNIRNIFRPDVDEITVIELENIGITLYYK